MIKIRIPASKIASCIGLNPYTKIDDTILDLYKYKKLGTIEKLEKKNLLDSQSKSELCKILKIPINSPIGEIQEKLKNNLDSFIIDKKKEKLLLKLNKELSKSIKSDINMRKGVLNEYSDLDRLEKKNDIKIINRNSQIGTIFLNFNNIYEIRITGKIDGYCNETKCIIETKHRRNRLFGKVPEYEKIQCEVYMRIFNCDKCYHTETYMDKSREQLLKKDDLLWKKITQGLRKKFIPRYVEILLN